MDLNITLGDKAFSHREFFLHLWEHIDAASVKECETQKGIAPSLLLFRAKGNNAIKWMAGNDTRHLMFLMKIVLERPRYFESLKIEQGSDCFFTISEYPKECRLLLIGTYAEPLHDQTTKGTFSIGRLISFLNYEPIYHRDREGLMYGILRTRLVE
jgi:hypothetical protein